LAQEYQTHQNEKKRQRKGNDLRRFQEDLIFMKDVRKNKIREDKDEDFNN
jgi:hypothetical protein